MQSQAMKLFIPAVAMVLASATATVGQTNTPSSADDRARFVLIAHELEKAPLDESLQADRKWAMKWLTDAPDVSVDACLTPLGSVSKEKYAYGDDIIVSTSCRWRLR